MSPLDENLIDAALAYVALGWNVLPLIPGTKRPLTENGFKDATTNPDQILRWWTDTPDANIGVATGKVSGISVVDVDIKPWQGKQGDEILTSLTDKHDPLPLTLMQDTWSGGKHILFAYREGAPNSAGCYGKWLDGRNDGGYIVVAPSHVVEGTCEGTYQWLDDPRTTALATMPDWLFAEGQKEGQKDRGGLFAPANGIPTVKQLAEHGRNNALTSLAGTMRRRDVGEETVRAALMAENERFSVPLPEREVETIVKSAMRNMSADPDCDIGAGISPGPHGTDQYYAEQFALVAGETVRFNDESGKWYVYDGKRWAMATDNAVIPFIIELGKDLYRLAGAEPDQDKAKRLATSGVRLGSSKVVTGILRLAQALPQLQVKAEDFDPDEHLLNVENGVLDLRTGELLPHDPKLMMSRLAPVAYDSDAVFSLWEETVRLALQGDEDKIAFVQRALGYSLTGYTSEDKFVNLVGASGGNGKTTIITAVSTLLGDYATTLRVEALLAGHEHAIPHDLADLRGKRFVVTSETPKGKRFDDRLLKMLTGDDEITACYKYGNNFRFYPQFKLFMYSNHPPKVSASDEAVWRRAVTVRFDYNFKTYAGFDPKVKDKLRSPEARAGILAWLVRGALAWQKDGLMIPKIVEAETAAHRLSVSEVQEFLDEMCRVDPSSDEDDWATTQKLHRAFLAWGKEHGLRGGMAREEFVDEMKRLGYESEKHLDNNRNRRPRWKGVILGGEEDSGMRFSAPF
jgi:putative DNA primase/helicase